MINIFTRKFKYRFGEKDDTNTIANVVLKSG